MENFQDRGSFYLYPGPVLKFLRGGNRIRFWFVFRVWIRIRIHSLSTPWTCLFKEHQKYLTTKCCILQSKKKVVPLSPGNRVISIQETGIKNDDLFQFWWFKNLHMASLICFSFIIQSKKKVEKITSLSHRVNKCKCCVFRHNWELHTRF